MLIGESRNVFPIKPNFHFHISSYITVADEMHALCFVQVCYITVVQEGQRREREVEM